MNQYLESTNYIVWKTDGVLTQAKVLAEGLSNHDDITRACFEFVRDEIKHSLDYKLNPVTCKASDVVKHGTVYCYAKSHLLAALLSANNIPARICYQRLTINGATPPFGLHGLNAAYLGIGWYQLDPRGNKKVWMLIFVRQWNV